MNPTRPTSTGFTFGKSRPSPKALPLIWATRTRCPRCNGWQLIKYRSIRDQGDGSAMAWMRCLNPACAQRFRIIWE